MKEKAAHYLLIVIVLISIIQAIFTPIIGDEAYYWMYSQQLAAGYFDHPPMVAWLTAFGNMLFSGTFGLRFMTIVLSIGTYFLLWKLLPKELRDHPKAVLLYLLLIIAIPICNVYSFITTPDAALLFFTVLYLKFFQNFLAKQNLKTALLLGISAALLMYTKYHGAIIIILTFLPNLKLLKSIHFYIATTVGLLLYTPHIIWQYQHDFITFKFHLIDRADKAFKFKNVINYILATILVLNPILFITFLIQKIKKRTYITLEKHYYYLFYGGLIFFLISSFRDKIEPHWIFFTVAPFILLCFSYVVKNYNKPLLKYGLGIVIVLLVFFRIVAMTPAVFQKVLTKDDIALLEFHKEGKNYFSAVDSLANGLPVVFVNSYQKASKYAFYTGKTSFSANNYFYRKNQYDLWDFNTIEGKKVVYIGNYPHTFMDTLVIPYQEPIYYTQIQPFYTLNNITSTILSIEKTADITYKVTFSITNNSSSPIHLIDDTGAPLRMVVKKDGKNITSMDINTTEVNTLPPNKTINASGVFRTRTPLKACELFLTLKQLDKHYITVGEPVVLEIKN